MIKFSFAALRDLQRETLYAMAVLYRVFWKKDICSSEVPPESGGANGKDDPSCVDEVDGNTSFDGGNRPSWEMFEL